MLSGGSAGAWPAAGLVCPADSADLFSPAVIAAATELALRADHASEMSPVVIVVCPSAAAATALHSTSSGALPAVAGLFIESEKFIECVQRLQDAKRVPAVVVGSVRRISDLISRGVMRTDQLRCLVLHQADTVLSTASFEQLSRILEGIDCRSAQLVATCTAVTDDVTDLFSRWGAEVAWVTADQDHDEGFARKQ
jgi:hypothetical protein